MQMDSSDRLASMYLRDSLPLPTSSANTTEVPSAVLHVMGGGIGLRGEGVSLNEIMPAALLAAEQAKFPVSEGRKYDGDKAPVAQGVLAYFGKALAAVGLISAYGAKKYNVAYSEQNWRKVDNAKGRYADALLRHLEAHLRGEINDPESGKPHVDHMAWNALALSELEKQ